MLEDVGYIVENRGNKTYENLLNTAISDKLLLNWKEIEETKNYEELLNTGKLTI